MTMLSTTTVKKIGRFFQNFVAFSEYLNFKSKDKRNYDPVTIMRAEKMVFCYQNCSEPTVRKNCSSDRENLLKFKAEG